MTVKRKRQTVTKKRTKQKITSSLTLVSSDVFWHVLVPFIGDFKTLHSLFNTCHEYYMDAPTNLKGTNKDIEFYQYLRTEFWTNSSYKTTVGHLLGFQSHIASGRRLYSGKLIPTRLYAMKVCNGYLNWLHQIHVRKIVAEYGIEGKGIHVWRNGVRKGQDCVVVENIAWIWDGRVLKSARIFMRESARGNSIVGTPVLGYFQYYGSGINLSWAFGLNSVEKTTELVRRLCELGNSN